MTNPREEMLKRIQEARKRVEKRVDKYEDAIQETQVTPTAVDSLIVTMLDNSQISHRRNAVLDLIRLRNEIEPKMQSRISSYLIKALEKEIKDAVRPAIISGIGEYYHFIPGYLQILHEIVLNDKGKLSRTAAAAVLGRLKIKESVDILEKVILQDTSEDVRFEAKMSLNMILNKQFKTAQTDNLEKK